MITLTTEQAQQIEEALVEYRDTQMIKAPRKALSIIRAARAQEQAEQEPVAIVEDWPTDSTPKGIVALGDIKEFPAGTLLYASPAISTEVFTREKVDSLLIAAYTKGRNDLLEKQAEQEPVMDYERLNALREGEQNGAEDAYFFVRPENDTPTLRKMFCQGFERGFHKGIKYAAPVSIESAVLAEREACAKVCEPVEGSAYELGVYKTMQTLAAAIRVRSEQ